MMWFLRTPALLPALLLAYLLGGCASADITALSGTRLDMVTIPAVDHDSWITGLVRATDTSVVLKYITDDQICVACYGTSLENVWRYNTDPETIGEKAGVPYFEIDRSVIYRTGNRISLIMYGNDRTDSAMAFVRQFDAATGRDLGTKCISRLQLSRRIDQQKYRVAISPDSTRIALSIPVETAGGDSVALRMSVFDTGFREIGNGLLTIRGISDEVKRQVFAVNNNGAVYDIWYQDNNTIRGTEYDLANGQRKRSLTVSVFDPEYPDALLGGGTVWFPNDSQFVMFNAKYDGDDMVGTSITRLDLGSFRTDYAKYFAASPDLCRKLIDDNTLEDATPNTVIITNHPTVQFLMVNERTYSKVSSTKRHTTTTYYTEHLIPFAFDNLGNPVWQQAVEKYAFSTNGSLQFIMSDASITDRGTLRVMYRENEEFITREYKLTDGMEVPGSRKTLATMGAAANYLASTFKWVNDDDLMFVMIQSPEWKLCRLRMAK